MYNIGNELKAQRELAGKSQTQLAKETGITQQKISYYESNKHSPPIEDCITLADYYGITLDELVGRDEIKNNFNLDQRHNNGTINNNF